MRFAVDPVHHARMWPRQVRRVQQPRQERFGFNVEPEIAQGAQRQRRVAQPAVAVVPVADAADALGQRCGRGRDDGTGWCVTQELEHESASHDGVAIRAVIAAGSSPLIPPSDGPLDSGVGVLAKRSQHELACRARRSSREYRWAPASISAVPKQPAPVAGRLQRDVRAEGQCCCAVLGIEETCSRPSDRRSDTAVVESGIEDDLHLDATLQAFEPCAESRGPATTLEPCPLPNRPA